MTEEESMITFDAFKLKLDSGVYKNGTAARRALSKLRGLNKTEEENAGKLVEEKFGPPAPSKKKNPSKGTSQAEVCRIPALLVRYFSLDYKSRMAILEFLRVSEGVGISTCTVLLSILEESEGSLRKK